MKSSNGISSVQAQIEAGEMPPKIPIDIAKEEEEEDDPWALTDVVIPTVPWSDLTCAGKIHRVLWEYIGRAVCLVGLLYMFICSIDLLSSAFQALGGKAAGSIFRNSDLLSNPFCGIMIGVLVTVLVQSSSTSTSIVVTMVSTSILSVDQAVYIIMGANVGTSVTNTIVSMGQSANKNEFRRAFGGATVHDMFNWLAVLVILPLEMASHYLVKLTGLMLPESLDSNEGANVKFLKVITEPFTKLIIQINKKAINDAAEGKMDSRVVKTFCKFVDDWVGFENVTKEVEEVVGNTTVMTNVTILQNVTVARGVERCHALFSHVDWSDAAIGALLLVISLISLTMCLVGIVKLLQAMLKGKVASAIKKIVNADLPGYLSCLTGYIAILLGAGLTIVVQSSSIFTSTLTPLVGIGMVSLERMYPLTLGSNIGTTGTGILAALAASGSTLRPGMQIALCHLLFNISGILIWYPIPILRRCPLRLAKALGNVTAEYRWFAILYIILCFFFLPGIVLGLSVAGWYVLLGVGLPVVLFLIAIIVINVLQNKKPHLLPRRLQSWEWLPECLRSFRPLDRLFSRCCFCKCCDSIFQRGIVEGTNPEAVIIGRNGQPIDIMVPSSETKTLALPVQGYTNVAFETEKDLVHTSRF